MKQKLLWMPPGDSEGYVVPKCYPVELPKEGVPDRLWTILREDDPSAKPNLPIDPIHHKNAFLEDRGHDWSVYNGELNYFGIAGYGSWLLLEYKDDKN